MAIAGVVGFVLLAAVLVVETLVVSLLLIIGLTVSYLVVSLVSGFVVLFVWFVGVLAEFLLMAPLSMEGVGLSYFDALAAGLVNPDMWVRMSVVIFAVGFILFLHSYRLTGSLLRSIPDHTVFEYVFAAGLGLSYVFLLWLLMWVSERVSTGLFVAVNILVFYWFLLFIASAIDSDSNPDSSSDMDTSPSLERIFAEVKRTTRRIGDVAGRPGYLIVATISIATLWAVHVAAGVLSTTGLFVRLSGIIGSLVVVAHLALVVRAEWNRDAAVLRDAKAVAGTDEPAPAELQARVNRLAANADLVPPDVRVGHARTPIAVTVGYRPSTTTLVVSRGLLESIDDRELDAVLAHELAHVANRDAAVLTALSVPAARARASIDHYGSVPHLAFLASLVRTTTRWSITFVARAREYAADDGAVAITGDPAALASALETLDDELAITPARDLRTSSAAAFSIVPPPWEEHRFFDRTRRFIARRLFGTHPPTEKRIERLRSRY